MHSSHIQTWIPQTTPRWFQQYQKGQGYQQAPSSVSRQKCSPSHQDWNDATPPRDTNSRGEEQQSQGESHHNSISYPQQEEDAKPQKAPGIENTLFPCHRIFYPTERPQVTRQHCHNRHPAQEDFLPKLTVCPYPGTPGSQPVGNPLTLRLTLFLTNHQQGPMGAPAAENRLTLQNSTIMLWKSNCRWNPVHKSSQDFHTEIKQVGSC